MLQFGPITRVVDHAVRKQRRVGTDLDVPEPDIRSDAHAIAQRDLPSSTTLTSMKTSRPIVTGPRVEAGRIRERCAGFHEFLGAPLPVRGFDGRELQLVVDSSISVSSATTTALTLSPP
jgi:hypothetical protein